MRKIVLAVAALLLTAACGESGPAEAPTPSGAPTNTNARQEEPPDWLVSMSDADPPAASCAVHYPDELPEQPIALDGTILSVQREAYDEDAAGAPVTVELRVNEAFRGDLGETLTVRTWDFTNPGASREPDSLGVRLLAAMTDSRDLMACGFTRPYSEQDAQAWREAFGGKRFE